MLIKSYVEEISKRVKGKRVLDVGCCASYSRNLLKRHRIYKKSSKEIIGIDINKKLIKEAKDRLNYIVHYCDLTNINDVKNIIDKFGNFNTVICTDVIEHVGNLTNMLDNINYIMTDDGVLHLTTPNMRSPRWMQMFVNRKVKVNPDHICWFDIFTLKNLLKRSGFKVVETMYHSLENSAISFLKLTPQDWMARRIYVVVKKE